MIVSNERIAPHTLDALCRNWQVKRSQQVTKRLHRVRGLGKGPEFLFAFRVEVTVNGLASKLDRSLKMCDGVLRHDPPNVRYASQLDSLRGAASSLISPAG